MFFKVDDINATFRISVRGGSDEAEYTLQADETLFDDMEEWKDVIEVPKVGHSTYE